MPRVFPVTMYGRGGALKLLIDTDASTDWDDMGALTCALTEQAKGTVEVIGINVNSSNAYAPGALDAQRKWMGFGSIPFSSHALVGTFDPNGPGVWTQGVYDAYPHDVGLASTVLAPVTNMRTLLAANSGVVLVMIGFGNDVASLLQSPADGISPLTGLELVAQSVRYVVWTGGVYPNGTDPWNFAQDLTDAAYVINNCPVPIYFNDASSNGFNSTVLTPTTLTDLASSNPCRGAYADGGSPHASWDLMTVLYSIEGVGTDFSVVQGTNSLNTSSGVNTFTAGAGNQYYLVANSTAATFEAELSALMNPARGGAQVLQTGPGGYGTTATATLTSVATTSTLFVWTNGSAGHEPAISDTAATHYTWTEIAHLDPYNTSGALYCFMGTGGSGGTFTVTASVVSPYSVGAYVQEVSGSVSVVGTPVTASGTGAFSTPSVTPTSSSQLVVASVGTQNSGETTPALPWSVDISLGYNAITWVPTPVPSTAYSGAFGNAGGWGAIALVIG